MCKILQILCANGIRIMHLENLALYGRSVNSGHVWSKMIRYPLNFLESLCDSLFQLCHVSACLGEGGGGGGGGRGRGYNSVSTRICP